MWYRQAGKLLRIFYPYLVLTGLGLFMFRGIFAQGFMSGYDNSFHYCDACYLKEVLIPQYHWIAGWSMRNMAGLPIFVDYYQAPFIVMAVLSKIFFLPLLLSYKILVLASYTMLGFGFYKLASFRFGKPAAIIAAVCLMLQKDIYLDKILNGIWVNYFALGILCIFLHFLDKHIDTLDRTKSLWLGLLLGLIIVTHIFVAIFAFLLLLIYAFPYRFVAASSKQPKKAWLVYAAIPLVAVVVSSYYLYGFFAARNYFGTYSYKDIYTGVLWSIKSFFGPIEDLSFTKSKIFFLNLPILIRIIFSFLGIFLYIVGMRKRTIQAPRRRFLSCLTAFIVISLLLFSDLFQNNIAAWYGPLPFLSNLQTNRFLIYVHLGLYLFAAYGIAEFLRRKKWATLFVIALTGLLLGSAACHHTCFARDASQTLDRSPDMPNIYALWSWVKGHVPTGEGQRIVYQNTIGNSDEPLLARSDIFALSWLYTGVPQLGVDRSASPFPQERYTRTDRGMIFARPVKDITPRYLKRMMDYFNAGHIVTVEDGLAGKLAGSELFAKEYSKGPYAIFRVKDFSGSLIAFKMEGLFETLMMNDQKMVFRVENRQAHNDMSIKVAYHPLWEARVNGKRVKLHRDRYGLMKLHLPAAGACMVELSFKASDPLWVGISLGGFILSVLLIFAPIAHAVKYIMLGLAAFLVAYFGMDIMPPIVIGSACFVAGILLIRRYIGHELRRFAIVLFAAALFFQVSASLFLYDRTIATKYYGFSYKGDDYVYGDFGVILSSLWREGRFPSLDKMRSCKYNLIGEGVDIDKYQFYNALIFYLFGLYGTQALLIINCFLHAIIIIPLYRMARRFNLGVYPVKIMIFLFFFWPSTLYWSLFNFKEPAVLLVLFLIFEALTRILESKRFIDITFLICFLAVLYFLKNYVGIICIITSVLYFIFFAQWPYKKLMMLIMLLLAFVKQCFKPFFSDLYAVVAGLPNFFFNIRFSRQEAASAYFVNTLTFTYPRLIAYLPIGILATLFLPFTIRPANMFQAIANLESIIWWCVIPFLIRGIWIACTQEIRKAFPLLISFFLVLIFFALTEGNMGTLVRHKSILYFIGFFFVALAIDRLTANKRYNGKTGRP